MKQILIYILLITAITGRAQIAPNNYWVQFTDKNGTEYSIDKPWEFLSQKALMRREKHNVEITAVDLPVSKTYLDYLKKLHITIRYTSRWLNGCVITTTDNQLIDTLHQLSFIAQPLKSQQQLKQAKKVQKKQEQVFNTEKLGSDRQISMINTHLLHQDGYKGNGLLVAILDGGFAGVDTISAFKYLFKNNQIIATRNYTYLGTTAYESSGHGTNVLSTIACNPNTYAFPAAPEASFVLLRTEYTPTEYLMEEYNWLAGAEFADSIGADIINSSLGYSTFDDSGMDHAYSDLNGHTTIVSRAASMAAKRGILVVCSAGNEYNDNWKYITAPGDADSILTIGAVDAFENITSFSSRGPTYDGRIKPDVVAQGQFDYVIGRNGTLGQSSGTSFSSPVMAGSIACLMQSTPQATIWDIMDAVKKSADRYNVPDSIYGYGLPNFNMAREILSTSSIKDTGLTEISVTPNPIQNNSFIKFYIPWIENPEMAQVKVTNVLGQLVYSNKQNIQQGKNIIPVGVLTRLNQTGVHYLSIVIQYRAFTTPIYIP